MVKKFHELKIGDVFVALPNGERLKFCKIAEPIPGIRKSEQLPNAVVIDDLSKWCSIRPVKDYLNSEVGNYMVLSYDGCSFTSKCKHCGKDIMQDSQGNWF